jgi:hypothetical protein
MSTARSGRRPRLLVRGRQNQARLINRAAEEVCAPQMVLGRQLWQEVKSKEARTMTWEATRRGRAWLFPSFKRVCDNGPAARQFLGQKASVKGVARPVVRCWREGAVRPTVLRIKPAKRTVEAA